MAMPSSLLWAVDIFGRVYTLSTVGQYWELCKDTQLEFKRVSAVKQCCWGIACDHQVYTYVFSGDVPIRYQEETYENQAVKNGTQNTRKHKRKRSTRANKDKIKLE